MGQRFLVALLAPLLLLRHAVGASPAPVVIVPGDGSNQLEAKWDKPSVVSWRCGKQHDWSRLWLDTSYLLLGTACWADNIRLLYDEEHDRLSNNLGVTTRVPDFGGTSAIEELDPSVPAHATAAFRKMVLAMVSAGLVKNSTLRGAPYDFRYAPSSSVGARYTADLRGLIESTAHATGQRVNLVSHSMGCLQVLYLLHSQPQSWKDQYIEKWVPLAGPFGGAAQEMRLFASGNNEGLPVSSLSVREEQRSYETNFWLAPVPKWYGDQVLVTTDKRNYSAQDYDDFFDDIGFAPGKRLRQRIVNLTAEAPAPGVDVVCMYSLGVKTPIRFNYGSGGFDQTPETVNGDGDGTVNDLSLKLCERWARPGAQARSARVVPFTGISHAGMLTDDGVLKALFKELGLEQLRKESVVMRVRDLFV